MSSCRGLQHAQLLNRLVLVLYEYMITFGDEVAVVWRRKLRGGPLLLLTTRYAMVILAAIALVPVKNLGPIAVRPDNNILSCNMLI
jgi:hypothetical protein